MPHKRKGKMFWDYFTCPKCGAKNELGRYGDSAGKLTRTLCRECRKEVKIIAGNPLEVAEREK